MFTLTYSSPIFTTVLQMTQHRKTHLKIVWSLFRSMTWPSPTKAESAEKPFIDEMEADEAISYQKRRLKIEIYFLNTGLPAISARRSISKWNVVAVVEEVNIFSEVYKVT